MGLGAKLTEFGGWDMPLQFHGIVKEHLATRSGAGLFDVSHMGRFVIRGPSALAFLQHVLTNNSAGLTTGLGQYTIIANEAGGAVDDAYLYRFFEGEYLLVVNAGNRTKDWEHLQELRREFSDTEMVDRTLDLAMLSLQGPRSKEILTGVLDSGELPEPMRNALGVATVGGVEVWIARTGYTGEPICFRTVRRERPCAGGLGLASRSRCNTGRAGREGYAPAGGGFAAVRARVGSRSRKATRYRCLPRAYPALPSALPRSRGVRGRRCARETISGFQTNREAGPESGK